MSLPFVVRPWSPMVAACPIVLLLGCIVGLRADAQEPTTAISLADTYRSQIVPWITEYCVDCHCDDLAEADVNLAGFASLDDVRKDAELWQCVGHMLDTRQMPPKDAEQLDDESFDVFARWVQAFLTAEAESRSGDPGPVVLRRLSNAEYTYTLRDLTGVSTLDPAAEFPVDGAAGEGFTNTGNALVMSPALVMKYLDAAKRVAEHLVLLPDGIEFSPTTTRRDWTAARLDQIREFYGQYSDSRGGTAVNLQGIQFDTNQGGRLPFDEYLRATLVERESLRSGAADITTVAQKYGLNAKYLGLLWQAFNEESSASDSRVLQQLRSAWTQADESRLGDLTSMIQAWQSVLWRFNAVGQIGREGGPTAWQEPIAPMVDRQEFRIPLPELSAGQDLTVTLAVDDAGDGSQHDWVIWENARLERPGQMPIPLRDVLGLQKKISERRAQTLNQTARFLELVSQVTGDVDVDALAAQNQLSAKTLRTWLRVLDREVRGPATITGHFTEKMERAGDYDFVQGWGRPQTPSFNANSSDQEVRIPGTARPHSVIVHPSPTLYVAAGWQSPLSGIVQVKAAITDAHSDCGNGIQWFLLHRFGHQSRVLESGLVDLGGSVEVKPHTVALQSGEVIALLIGPRDGNHACDLTQIEMSISDTRGERTWDLATDVADEILSGNPHADHMGNPNVWHFYQGEMTSLEKLSSSSAQVPTGSLLDAWQHENDTEKRQRLANQIQQLLVGPIPADPVSADALLYRLIHQVMTPSIDEELRGDVARDERFMNPAKASAGELDLVVQAPAELRFRLPAEMASGAELVVSGRLDPELGHEGSTRLQIAVGEAPVSFDSPGHLILVANDSKTRARIATEFERFRELFPIALCYTQIVPVDEVVTLRLYYREDEWLKRLMLDATQAAALDRMWDELFYVSQEPLELTVAFEQLSEFATQDRPDIVVALEPLRKPINDRGAEFRERLIADEPQQLRAVVEFARKAWRRPLSNNEESSLIDLYRNLRKTDLSHEEAMRLTLARILTAPAFLYRLESPPPGQEPAPVSDIELANRLSYFLWSSVPDEELTHLAQSNRLSSPDVLAVQTERLLADERARRMAIHFACQWLGIRDFDQHDEKNEKLYPEFVDMRHAMYEESVRFFEDMIRNDGSILDLLDADHTFVNQELAEFYGMEAAGIQDWQRVEGIKDLGRGGVLGMATVLSKQSGASRTSPILRGNWVYETLLGQRLPRPPANVPQLPDNLPAGLSERQLIEMHSSIPECAKCHQRIDPFGFALEQFDAVGKMRLDPVDTQTKLMDDVQIQGLSGLRSYLLDRRRDEIVRQFCRKLLGYALGRGVQLSDEPLLSVMQQRLEAQDYRFSEAVKVIVLSPQFLEIRGRDVAIE